MVGPIKSDTPLKQNNEMTDRDSINKQLQEDNLTNSYQHSFMENKSCQINLISFDKGNNIDVTDFIKHQTALHDMLIKKLE